MEIIYLYNEGVKGVDLRKLEKFIQQAFGKFKVKVIRLKKQAVFTKGLLFDFVGTEKEFTALNYSKAKDTCHIILTSKLFATFDEPSPCAQWLGEQKRLHIRSSIYGFPSIISTSGIVEGPAKPKEYYLYKQKYTQLGIWEREGPLIKKKFKGRFIDYQDKRLTEVLKGYLSQAIFFYLTGNPFCPSRKCRLFNAHWQEDLIYSQIKSAKFCPAHQKVLAKIKNSP